MNSTIQSYVGFALGTLMTMTALAYTFWSMTGWPGYFQLVPSAATVFVEQTDIPEEVSWTGTQVVAKLYQLSDEENLSIVVDGFTFESIEDVEANQWRVSLQALYTQDIQSSNGQVSKIIYSLKGVQ